MDAADQSAREKNGYGDGLTQALTLVVAPVLFGLLGAFIDRVLGTSPLFLLVLGFIGILATCVTAYFEYEAPIAPHDEGKPWARQKKVDVTAYERGVARDLVDPTSPDGRARSRSSSTRSSPLDGAISAAIGLVLVATNFLVGARIISWTAQRSPGAVMGAVMGGYLARMAALVRRRARARTSSSSSTFACSSLTMTKVFIVVTRVGNLPREPLVGCARARTRSPPHKKDRLQQRAGVCIRGLCLPSDRRALSVERPRVQQQLRLRSTRPRSSCSRRRSWSL